MSYYPFIKNYMGHISDVFPVQYYIIKKTLGLFPKSSTSEFLKISPITDNIYLSGINGANNLDEIKIYNITYIINCTKDIPNYFENDNIKYMRVPIDDTSNQHIEQYFDSTYNFIENAIINKCNILVHCYAGISRSATILIAYFMRKYNISYMKAYEFVKSKRSIINPNKEFVEALKEYQITLNILN